MPRDIPLERVRNLGIMAHVDAGKTTVTERVLFHARRIHHMGEVHHGTATMDHHTIEQRKGITIAAAATTLGWTAAGSAHALQLIDTPGHVDFTIEVERALRVLDGAVMVLDAASGVEPQTETVWRQAERHRVARVVFVNKVDRPGADLDACARALRERLGAHPVVLARPWLVDGAVVGVVDVLRNILAVTGPDGRETTEHPVPEALRAIVARDRESLLERCAEIDDALAAAWLEHGPDALNPDDVRRALRVATLHGTLTPVLCGSALKNQGIAMLLDHVVHLLPSPLDRPAVTGTDPRHGTAVSPAVRDDGPVCALAFKVGHDRAAGAITWLRVYAGTLRAGMQLLDAARGRTVRVGRLARMHAGHREDITEAPAGAIVAALGLRDVRTGTTLSSPNDPVVLDGLEVPDPVVELAVEPARNADLQRLADALGTLAAEDPSLQVVTDPERGTLLRGVGELHLEVTLERLRLEHGVEARVGEPRVAYRDTVMGPSEARVRLARQNGGVGQFAEVLLAVAPAPRGAGLVFTDETRGGVIPAHFATAVHHGLRDAMTRGAREGVPLVDLSVRLLDGLTHEKDSSVPVFEIVASLALRACVEKCGLLRLEPVMATEFVAPEACVGDVMSLVQSRRGRVLSLESQGAQRVVRAEVPMASLFGQVTALRSRTQGRASMSARFSHYAPARSA